MKKLFLILLLSICVFSSVDTHRDVIYNIDENLNVDTTYIDTFYGDVQGTLNYINMFDSEAEYIETRVAPDFTLQKFEIYQDNETLKLTIHGRYNNYIKKQGSIYKVGGKGFIDRTCKDYPIEMLNPIRQTFYIEATIPENYKVIQMPPELEHNNSLYVSYMPSLKGNKLIERIHFELANQTSIRDYCIERDKVNVALQAGFKIVKKDDNAIVVIGLILGIILIMIIVSRFLQ